MTDFFNELNTSTPTNGYQCLAEKPTMNTERDTLDLALKALIADTATFARTFIKDPQLRLQYNIKAQETARQYLQMVNSGKMSALQAAQEASTLRNEVLNLIRSKSTSFGRAYAESIKAHGKSFESLAQDKARKLFKVDFKQLTISQQEAVYREIVESSGRPNAKVNAQAKNFSRLGKGLLILSLSVAAYNVATADNKVRALGNEGAALGGGLAGGAAGGALAGLACGPGAPVCSTIGIIIGGALGGIGADYVFDYFFE